MATQVTYSLSPAETIIMEFIWGNNCHARTYEIMNYLVQDKGIKWERQTLNTVLIRLSNKGIIERKRGTIEAKYTKEGLLHIACEDFVDTKFNGKISDAIKAYCMNGKIPEKEAEEIINTVQSLI